jgi:hypothetical protein
VYLQDGEVDIFTEKHRIAQRQFHWQYGYFQSSTVLSLLVYLRPRRMWRLLPRPVWAANHRAELRWNGLICSVHASALGSLLFRVARSGLDHGIGAARVAFASNVDGRSARTDDQAGRADEQEPREPPSHCIPAKYPASVPTYVLGRRCA